MKLSIKSMLIAISLAGIVTAAAADRLDSSVTPPPPCVSSSAECLQNVASLYLAALASHDGSKLPLAPTVRRTENALTNANGPQEIRESFDHTRMVQGLRDARYYVDPAKGEVVVFFCADIDLKQNEAGSITKAGNSEYKVAVTVPKGTYTTHEAERFKIVHGLITEIEIIAYVENGTGGGSGWPNSRNGGIKPAAPAPP